MNIFEFTDYKPYLSVKISTDAQSTKGYRSQLVEAVGCQLSYLSQVLNGKPDFTLEQAFRLNQFFGHSKEESKYFLFLIEASRAGTHDLKSYFYEQAHELREARLNLKKRFVDTQDILEKDQSRYYSSWFYSAIYVILSIPEYQNPKLIAARLNLPLDLVLETIEFLEGCGLIANKAGAYVPTKRNIHLHRESDFIRRHHINWRSQSLQSTEKNLKEDLHYSTVIAISKADSQRIKEILAKSIEEAGNVMKPSIEEEIYAMTMDFFKL